MYPVFLAVGVGDLIQDWYHIFSCFSLLQQGITVESGTVESDFFLLMSEQKFTILLKKSSALPGKC